MLQLILSIHNAKLETPHKSKVSTIQHPREIKGTLLFFWVRGPEGCSLYFSLGHILFTFFFKFFTF